jgi:hypothetical protein
MVRRARLPFPLGHFYSPHVSPDDLDTSRIWPVRPAVQGIDFNDASHREVLAVDFPRYHPLYDYPDDGDEIAAPSAFFSMNSQFGWLDSRTLFVLMHKWRPKRVVEVGSGFSSLLIADVNRRWFDARIKVTCVEPYPREFLRTGIRGISRVVQLKVQDVPMAEFERLEAGDILFIDSSHVAKTGSDVNFLYFDVLPRLAPGVNIHVHDIFLPNDYPRHWVIDENRSWNEQYLLRALLMYSNGFKVVFGCSYAPYAFSDLVERALPGCNASATAGASFWMRRA